MYDRESTHGAAGHTRKLRINPGKPTASYQAGTAIKGGTRASMSHLFSGH